MTYFKRTDPTISLLVRAPRDLDAVLEQIALRERRTKVAVVSLSLEEYCEKHHPDLYAKYKGRTP